VRLGDYAKTEKGKKPKLVSDKKTEKCSIPYINIKAFEKNIIDEFTDGVGCVICEDDDFLMVWDGSRSGYVGKAIKGALGSTLVRIKLPEIDHNFAYYFLQSKFIEINTKAKGVGIPHVDPNLVWNYLFPMPPLNEQHQIVSKIEELFSELDKGKQQLETVKQQMKTYRQAVLKWAFEGRFTSAARTGRELSRDDQNKPQLPKGWKWVKLSDITDYISDGDHQPPPKAEIGIPFITISNVNKSNQKIDFSNTFKVSEAYYSNLKDNRKPKIGDILYTVTGSFGISIMVDFNMKFCFQRHIGLLHPSLVSNQKWLYYILQSQTVSNQAKATATGTAQKTVALKSLRNFNIPFCSLDEQKKIVSEIESRLSVCDKIEEIIETSLKQAESLRQSILKQAFEGRLVTTDL
jgi:type I restriction enzyme S subunit